MKKIFTLFLILTLTLSGCGCRPVDLMAGVPARAISVAEVPEGANAATDFAVRLFQSGFSDEENTLISPLSILTALGMTANGADGETLGQMEQVLGLSVDNLNGWLYGYRESQSEALKLANSIWFTNDPLFQVNQDFLETNADFYQAGLYQTAFDQSALTAINEWVNAETDGMIPKILDQVPEEAVMYLINALAFEAQWEEVYQEHHVHDGTFTQEDGTQQNVQMMSSQEYRYLEDENATGFLKYYEGRRYAFAALLPKEGITISEYISSLTGEQLRNLLDNPNETTVYANIPKFETSYDADLADTLKAMGMSHAFDVEKADFSALGTYPGQNIYIGRVLHKTAITVAEQGTKAGAATAVEMLAGGSFIPEIKEVTLNRPFVYMIVDCEQKVPFFIGTLMDAESN